MRRPKIVIGTFRPSHLGDALCCTPLARMLSREGVDVWATDHPAMRAAFANNPYLRGFARERGIPMRQMLRGGGHVIQQLQQGFNLPPEAVPRPEIYFTEEELQWAADQRRTWPGTKPVCLIATQAVSDRSHLRNVNWQAVADACRDHFTLVHPILTSAAVYTEQTDGLLLQRADGWLHAAELPSAIVYRDLPLRHFLSLFTVVNCYIGGPSGGSHVAAALHVPSLIILWKEVYRRIGFPVSDGTALPDTYLYPYHAFICSEDLTNSAFRTDTLERLLRSLGSERSSHHSIAPPRRPLTVVCSTHSRLRRQPRVP